MAGELAPPQVANGGGGTASTGTVRAPDYRQLQSPAEVNTDLPNNEAAARAAELGSVFRQFEGIAGNEYNKVQTQAGAIAGAAAGATGHPQYRQGLERFTAYSTAFNNAATGAYAVEAEAQADDAAARLRVQANNNPQTFLATFSAVRDGVLKNAPPMAVPMLTDLYNKHLAEGMAAISGDQALQQQQLQKQTYDLGIERQTSRVGILQGSASPHDQLAALDEQVKLTALIDGGVKSGLYSAAEAQAMHINAAREITSQVFNTQVDRELARPDGDVIKLLERFRQAHLDNLANKNEPPILSEPEYQELMQNATTKLREWRLTQELTQSSARNTETVRFTQGDEYYTGKLMDGKLSLGDIDAGVHNGDLRPARATALRALLERGTPVFKSDPHTLYQVKTSPHFLDMSSGDIANLPNVSFADKAKLWDEVQARRSSWEGTQNVKLAKGSILAALKIPAGTPAAAYSDDQRRAATNATQEFLQIMQGTDPAKRDSYAMTAAQTVIKHEQQHEASANMQVTLSYKQSFIQQHGPGSADDQSGTPEYQQEIQHYDQLIKQYQSQARGE